MAAAAGQAMLVVGAAVVLIGFAATFYRARVVWHRALGLLRTVEALRYDIRGDLQLLASQREEAGALVAPWRKLWKLARHPLVVAAFRWYRRRRRH